MSSKITRETVCVSRVKNLSWIEEVFLYYFMESCDNNGKLDTRQAVGKSKRFPLNTRLNGGEAEQTLKKQMEVNGVRRYRIGERADLYLSGREFYQRPQSLKGKYLPYGSRAVEKICIRRTTTLFLGNDPIPPYKAAAASCPKGVPCCQEIKVKAARDAAVAASLVK